MYNTYTGGCNILSLQISRHKSIEVKSNNNKSWDYTNPILTVGEPNRMDRSNDMLGHSGNMATHKNLISDHPLLPMPMNMAAAAAAAATAAQHGHHFNPQSQNPYLTHNPHQSQHNQNNQQQGHFQSSNNISGQSVNGYSIQTMQDNRPAVVQVSNFPDQVKIYFPFTFLLSYLLIYLMVFTHFRHIVQNSKLPFKYSCLFVCLFNNYLLILLVYLYYI